MGSIRTGTTSGDTVLLQAYDVDGAAYITFGTLTAGNTPTFTFATTLTPQFARLGLGAAAGATTPLVVSGTASDLAEFIQTGTGQLELLLTRTAGTTTTWGLYIPAGSTDLRFYNGADRFTFTQAGTMVMSGYGNGSASFTGGNGTLTTSSDERLKRIQGPYEPGLAEILNVKPIRYKWIKDIPEAGVTPEQIYAGFSAQNVRDALGDLAVGQHPDGILSLQDRAILGALVNAVTELSALNDALEARLAALEGKAK